MSARTYKYSFLEIVRIPLYYYAFPSHVSTAGVGKSSLISAFVSRYFSPDVPGLMTRVRLPPTQSCVTTLIDSQHATTETLESVAVDSVVLVYDLDRAETFYRLERHWLPLIQRYSQGKVRMLSCICAGM